MKVDSQLKKSSNWIVEWQFPLSVTGNYGLKTSSHKIPNRSKEVQVDPFSQSLVPLTPCWSINVAR